MIPILYDKHKKTFTNDYTGILTDVITCHVTEGRNDEYELEMTYPIDGVFFDSLELDAIIKAKPNRQDDPQPFRIYKIVKKTEQIITVNARHIVFDLSKVTVEPFTSSGTIVDAINGMISHSIPACGFIFETDKTTSGNFNVSVPKSFRSLMGGTRGSILDVYGTAEYHYDGYNIYLPLNRGTDSGVTIKYGINLIDMEQEENCDKVFTAVYPFWADIEDFVTLDEKLISVGSFPFSRVMALDLSQDFPKKPTQAQLRSKATQYINSNDIGVPTVNLTVEFSNTDESQAVNLCDLVTIEFEKLGVSAKAKCLSLEYDVIAERVTKVKLGNYKGTFVDLVVDTMKGITPDAQLDTSKIDQAIIDTVHNDNGYVLFHSSTQESDRADEILILNGTDKLNLVNNIWRWNRNGLGFSSNGYDGAYANALTKDGKIVADMITTGRLIAIEMIAGNGKFHVTPDGVMTAKEGYIGSTTTGFRISEQDIQNTNIRLYDYGVELRDANKKPIGYIGKTDYIREAINIDWRSYDDPGMIVEQPGIGLNASSDAKAMGWYWHDSSASANRTIFNWVYTDSPFIEDGNPINRPVNVYINIDMQGNKVINADMRNQNAISGNQYYADVGQWAPNYIYVEGHDLVWKSESIPITQYNRVAARVAYYSGESRATNFIV